MRPALPLITLGIVAVAGAVAVLMWSRYADPEWTGRADLQSASIVGRVLDEHGKPMPNVELMWSAFAASSRMGLESAFRTVARTTSAADGSYRFSSLDEVQGFVAADPSTSHCEGRTGEFSPRNGFEARIDVIVEPISSALVVRGKLLRADGSPAFPWFVRLTGGTWFTKWEGAASSREDGSFEVVLPFALDEVELTSVAFETGAALAPPIKLRPGEDVTLRVDGPK